MTDREEVREILEETMENPFWAAYYNDAPSDRCKEYIALEFYYSEYEDDETARALDQMENDLAIEDWKHLLKYSGNNPGRGKIAKRITELENNQQCFPGDVYHAKGTV